MNNKHNVLYSEYKSLSQNWPLDDWAIPKECFDKIVEILPFGSTILELGSGLGTELLSKFYKMISIETDVEWLNKYSSQYLHIPFDTMYQWYNPEVLKQKLLNIPSYDLLLIDGPKGFRHKIINHLDLFNQSIPWIFDDTMAEEHLNTMIECSTRLNKSYELFNCEPNAKAVYWTNGKQFALII